MPEAVYGGIAFSPDGRRLYVSGGGDKVRVYDVNHGHLAETDDGRTLYVADQLADAVSVVDLTSAAHPARTVPVGHNPYAVRLSADDRRVFVANQGANTVSVLDAGTGAVAATTTVDTHPDALTTGRHGQDSTVAASTVTGNGTGLDTAFGNNAGVTVVANHFDGNRVRGLSFTGTAGDVTVEYNLASGNGTTTKPPHEGIFVSVTTLTGHTTALTLTGNAATGNGATDGGHNTATGNGGAAQCAGVAC